jgi:diguanylate cyclase (GGDEF)-like protein/PAS domain S-box-containing protein
MRLSDALIFLPAPPESSLLYTGIYDPKLVVLSVFIAIFASLAALDVADRIRLADSSRTHMAWLALGALAMGSGIWAMHFVGMLALQLPCSVGYDTTVTLWSIMPGVLACGVAIEVLRHVRPTQLRLLAGSVLLGAGIGTMHYSGMAAMRIDGLVRYNPNLFVLSIGVAIALAYLALLIRYRVGRRWRTFVAATVMGCAVSGMHYTAMAATYFLRDGDPSIVASELEPTLLAAIVSVVTSLLIALAIAITIAARYQETARRLRESEFRIRSILETTQEGFVQVGLDMCINEVNPAFCTMLERSRGAVIGHPIVEFFTPESVVTYETEMRKRAAGVSTSYRVTMVRPDGSLQHCEFHGTPIYDRERQRVGAFGLVTDINDRIAHEAYVRQAVAVFENTAEGVTLTDPRGRIISINPAFTRITGYAEEDVVGKNPALLRSGRHDDAFYREMWTELGTSGHWQGEIWNRRKNGEVYPEWLTISAVPSEDGRVQNYIGVFSDISHIKRSEAELQRLANYDPLTDLANRLLLGAQLDHALERAERHGESLAVMELDLDGFKNVNDTLGHPAGDKLLQIVADRLKDTLRSEDIIARLGGDEFAVVLESLDDVKDVEHVAQKIIDAIAKPLELEGQLARVTCSIGIALFPDDGRDATMLLKAADTALYVSKREGRNTFRYYSTAMAESVRHRHEVEQGLRLAIENDQLELWYQPQVDTASGRVVGVEALVRWRHPERGIIPPLDFLPIAADTGLILPLGEWVLRHACRQALAWRNAGLGIEHVSVNVDSQQIVRSDFVATVERVLAETGLPPSMLELEITESFLLENAENGMGTVMRFAEMGVDVAIDDFGTGYSSLSYLKYLRADCLKIDKSFVDDLPADATSAAIIRAIVSLGRGLGFTLVAEGVETASQLAYLRSVGCDLVQGYLLARPMPATELEAWVRAGKATDSPPQSRYAS